MKDPLDITGGNKAAQVVGGALLYAYCGLRALTYPVRYLSWRAKGNGLQKTPDGKEVLVYHDPKPTVFFPLLLIVMLTGCTSISYGPMTIRSIGVDATFEDAQWARVNADGESEAFVIHGVKKNATESTHTVANMALAIAGAIIGSPGGPPGAAAGAVTGGGVAEAIQLLRDHFSNSSTNSTAGK